MWCKIAMMCLMCAAMAACKSDDGCGFLLVTVDAGRNPMAGTKVQVMTLSSTARQNKIDTLLVSDESGYVEYSYPFECFLNIRAVNYKNDSLVRSSKELHLEEGKQIKDTIVLW